MRLKRMTLIAMFLAMAIVLSMVESLIPMVVPGVKLGLANCIVLLMLYEMKWQEAAAVMFLRILIVGILRGNLGQMTWLMSLSGGMISFLIMLLFSKIKIFSIIGTSVLGAVSHAAGQIFIAMLLLETGQVIYYLPLIGVLSTITGIFTGVLCKIIVKRKLLSNFMTNTETK